MSDPDDKPPFSFRQILTAPVIAGLPGARVRLERRKSFFMRFIRRYLGGGEAEAEAQADQAAALANAGRVWTTAARAFHGQRVDSLIRCITTLRQAVDAIERAAGRELPRQQIDLLTRRAWQDVKAELASRLEAINERLEQADPQTNPDGHYWLQATTELDTRRWDAAAITHLCDEVRGIYQRLLWVKANVKFIALHIDDLRWLADYGAPAAEAMVAVPSNHALKQLLKHADDLKLRLNDELKRVLASSIGGEVKRVLRPNADISGIRPATPTPTRRG